MRTLFLLAAISIPTWAAPARVQSSSGGQSGSSTTIATTAIATTVHNTILIAFSTGNSCQTVIASIAVTDTAGNTYYQLDQQTQSLNRCIRTWIARDIVANASNVTTVTYSAAQTQSYATLIEISGANAVTPRDATFGIVTFSNATSIQTGPISTFYDDEIVWTAVWINALTGATWTPPTGYTQDAAAISPDQVMTSAYKTYSSKQTGLQLTWSHNLAVAGLLTQGVSIR